MEQTTLYDVVMNLYRQRKFAELKTVMGQLNPADVANIIENADGRDVIALFRLLPQELATEAFAYIDSEQQEQLILAFTDRELREVIDELFLDDTVDLIEEMPANIVNRILKNTDPKTREQINELLAYPADSAGSLMTPEYVYLKTDMTVEESFAKIRSVGVVKETIYTCYVTEERKLVGVVSLLDDAREIRPSRHSRSRRREQNSRNSDRRRRYRRLAGRKHRGYRKNGGYRPDRQALFQDRRIRDFLKAHPLAAALNGFGNVYRNDNHRL